MQEMSVQGFKDDFGWEGARELVDFSFSVTPFRGTPGEMADVYAGIRRTKKQAPRRGKVLRTLKFFLKIGFLHTSTGVVTVNPLFIPKNQRKFLRDVT